MEKIETKCGNVILKVKYDDLKYCIEYDTYCELNTNLRYILRLNLNKVNGIKNNNGKSIMFILKNPSHADQNTKDKTLTRLAGWTYHPIKNIHNFTICNLIPLKAKKSYELKNKWFDLNEEEKKRILEENDFKIKECLKEHDKIICGWGTNKSIPENDYNSRIKQLSNFQEIKTKTLFKVEECSKEGYPQHPLNWNYETEKSGFDIQNFLN